MSAHKTPAILSLIAARFGRGVGHFMFAVLLVNLLSTAAVSAKGLSPQNIMEDRFPSATQSYIICTPQGLKRITLDEDGNPVGGNDCNSNHCIFCLPFHQAVFTEFDLKAPIPNIELNHLKLYFSEDIHYLPSARLNVSCPPRAPPHT